MIFSGFDDLLRMGGHGPYVWASYGVTLAVILWLVISPLLRHRRLLADLARQQRREAAAATVRRTIDGEN